MLQKISHFMYLVRLFVNTLLILWMFVNLIFTTLVMLGHNSFFCIDWKNKHLLLTIIRVEASFNSSDCRFDFVSILGSYGKVEFFPFWEEVVSWKFKTFREGLSESFLRDCQKMEPQYFCEQVDLWPFFIKHFSRGFQILSFLKHTTRKYRYSLQVV